MSPWVMSILCWMVERRGDPREPAGRTAHRTAGSTTPATRTRTRIRNCPSVRNPPGLSTWTGGLWTPATRFSPAESTLLPTEPASYHPSDHGTSHILRPRHRPAGPHVADDVPVGPRLRRVR